MNYYSFEEAKRRVTSTTRDASPSIESRVKAILDRVNLEKDEALFSLTLQLDKVKLTSLRVQRSSIDAAYQSVGVDVVTSLKKAKTNIERFHRLQRYEPFEYEDNGRIIGQKVTPIQRVGLYIPGGTASYPSSVLMNAIPAQLAGVKELVLVSPPNQNGLIAPAILVAADLCGISEIYTVGGAQAIAALAYGTPTIRRVDKIVGPGNQYVAKAKALVSSFVGIDTVAGPSEVCILADAKSNPTYIAADLLAQAEHDALSRAICISNDKKLLTDVENEVNRLLPTLSRNEIARQAIVDYSMLIFVENEEEMVELVNAIAPEHLQLMTQDAWDLKNKITNAGAMFIGPYTPEPVGDYMAGPNHTLPTSSFARFASGLSTYDFLKRTSYVSYNASAFAEDKDDIIRLANEEGLTAHALSMKVRK